MSDQTPWTRQQELLFGVRRSIRYHTSRKRFFDRFRKFITFLTAALGVTTLTMLLSNIQPIWPMVTAVLVSLFATIDLILNTAEGARLHGELARRFIELEMDIVLAGETLDDAQLRQFAGRRLRISMEEPPIMRVLDCVCHNELVEAMGHGSIYEVKVTRTQRFFANFWDISPREIRINQGIIPTT
ncbi:MAG: hypothetical protein JWR26_413 [Pedosphaera sp.]|nr:hypothetical protein [Pedosphaera sp.]